MPEKKPTIASANTLFKRFQDYNFYIYMSIMLPADMVLLLLKNSTQSFGFLSINDDMKCMEWSMQCSSRVETHKKF